MANGEQGKKTRLPHSLLAIRYSPPGPSGRALIRGMTGRIWNGDGRACRLNR